MTATKPETMDRAFEAICMLLMPFFLIGAGDDSDKARQAAADLLRAYDPANPQELDLAARVVGFSVAALDNLRLSMAGSGLSDTKVLRYRSTAVSLSRSSEQCRATLKKIQAERPAHPVTLPQPELTRPTPPLAPMTTPSMDKAKQEARDLLAELARLGSSCPPGQGMTAIRMNPDPGAQITAAVSAALRGDPDPQATVWPR